MPGIVTRKPPIGTEAPAVQAPGIRGTGHGRPTSKTQNREPLLVRWLLIGVALLFLLFFLLLPLASVFAQAFEGGVRPYLEAVRDPDAIAAIRLTLLTAAIAVPLNVVFGVAAAWAIAKFNFIGKNVL